MCDRRRTVTYRSESHNRSRCSRSCAGEVLGRRRAPEVVVPGLVREIEVARRSVAAGRGPLLEVVRLDDPVHEDGHGGLRREAGIAVPVQVRAHSVGRDVGSPLAGLRLRQGAVEGQGTGERRAVEVEVDLPGLRRVGR